MDYNDAVLEEVREIGKQVRTMQQDVTTIKAWNVEGRLEGHSTRIRKLETLSARVLGGISAVTLVLGVLLAFINS